MARGSGSGRSGAGPRYTLAQFRSLEVLGAGSFGTVKRVANTETGEVFAMKVLEKDRVRQRCLEEQLKREVLTQYNMKHDNIVRLHYHFEDAHRIYCLLEFADQGTLFSLIKSVGKGLPEPQAASVFGDTASGLEYLHNLSIVHRDLKPENILLYGPRLVAKIGDFGWCVQLTPEEPERQTFCGTSDYLAPEMLAHEPRHDAGVDLWALGVLLFEILLGRAPFTARSPKEAWDKILSARYEIPSGSMSEAPAEIIRGLLVLVREDRMPLAKVLKLPWIARHHRHAACEDLEATAVVPRSSQGMLGDRAMASFVSAAAALNIPLDDERTLFVPKGGSQEGVRLKAATGRRSDSSGGAGGGEGSSSCSGGSRVARTSASTAREASTDAFPSRLRSPSPAPQAHRAPKLLNSPGRPVSSAGIGRGQTPTGKSGLTGSAEQSQVGTQVAVSSVPRPKAKSRRSKPLNDMT